MVDKLYKEWIRKTNNSIHLLSMVNGLSIIGSGRNVVIIPVTIEAAKNRIINR